MFAKAQRFDSKGVGCGADAIYDHKDLDKPIGGVITEGVRFESNESVPSKSDTEFVRRENSSPLFRTPKTLRPLDLASTSKRWPGKKLNSAFKSYSTDNFTRNILKSKDVEIRNKDEKISEYEQQIKEMNHIINKLNENLINYKYDDDKYSEKLIIAEEQIGKLQTQVQDLKENLHNSDESVKELFDSTSLLQKTIELKETQLRELYSNLQLIEESSLEHSNEVQNLKLQIKLNSNTTEALGHRLRGSDEEVEKLKLENLNLAKQISESELKQVKDDLKNYKLEYNQLLFTIINSKIALDESTKVILDKNSKLKADLVLKETVLVEDIEKAKNELEKDIFMFTQLALKQIGDLEKKVVSEHNSYLAVKMECDQAYKEINNCQTILLRVEAQLDTRERELDKMATENDRLSVALAAVDHEKNEQQVLLKSHDYTSKFLSGRKETYHLEEHLKEIEKYNGNNAGSQSDYRETNNSQDELSMDLQNQVSILEKKLTDLESHILTCKEDLLRQQNSSLERELADMTSKYTNLLGHQNNKQKIKHVNDLKTQNFTLKEENDKLSFTNQRNAFKIEKLKKKIAHMECKSPLPLRKQMLKKENITSPTGIRWSPKSTGSPILADKPLTPLRDLNR